MKLSTWLYFGLVVLYQCTVQAHSVDDRRLLRVEPLMDVKVELASRPATFYAKRNLTPNPIYTPTARAIEHDDTLRLVVNAHNQTLHLHLDPNLDLFHPNAVTIRGESTEPLRHEHWRIYKGHVIDASYSDEYWQATQAGIVRKDIDAGVVGWARVVLRPDLMHKDMEYPVFEGSFRVHDDLYHVKTVQNYQRVKRADDVELESKHKAHMIVYRDSDTVTRKHGHEKPTECGLDRLLFNQAPFQIPTLPVKGNWGILSLHSSFDSSPSGKLAKRAPVGCPSTQKINYMGVAADCSYARYYQTADNARTQIITDWNSASALYERTFNIGLGLINITLMPEECPAIADPDMPWNMGCSDKYSLGDRLNDFSRWRGSLGDDGAGLWHLMTSCSTGVEVGIAWLKQLCNTKVSTQSSSGTTQYVSGTGVSSIIRDEWKVVAHEIGHGFGAVHDCTSQDCPCSGSCQCCPLSPTQCSAGGTYIMNPSSNVSSNDFSPCSIDTICGLFPTLGSCLSSPGSIKVETLKMCGNGIKEEGEDCDTGGQQSNCCNPQTCKFVKGAVCDDFNDLCCHQCQLRPQNATCRQATSSCDYTEYCSGTSADCPPDKHVQDTTPCENGLQCASGSCTSRDAQCLARGAVVNVTSACPSSDTCDLSCQDPTGSGCMVFTGHFLDGTQCGLGGVCQAGTCNLGGIADQAKNWLANNKDIAIPVGVVLALILLSCLGRCLWSGCFGYGGCRKKNQVPVKSSVAQRPPPQYTEQNASIPPYNMHYTPPPPVYSRAPQNDWVDPRYYNGADIPPQSTPTPFSGEQANQTPPNVPRHNAPTPTFPNRPYNEGVV